MTINWQDKAVQDRLLTAFIASVNCKINVSEIARFYNQDDMTYYAVENYLRKFKKEAKVMNAQASGGDATPSSPTRPRTNGKKKNESLSKLAVKTGRVTKPMKSPGAKVKPKLFDDDPVFLNNMSNENSPNADDEEEIIV